MAFKKGSGLSGVHRRGVLAARPALPWHRRDVSALQVACWLWALKMVALRVRCEAWIAVVDIPTGAQLGANEVARGAKL